MKQALAGVDMTRRTRRFRWIGGLLLVGASACLRPALAQLEKPDMTLTKSSESLRAVFKNVVAAAEKSTVVIQAKLPNGRIGQVALGTVVGEDGHILTKASEVVGRESLKVIIAGKPVDARVVGVSEPQDLGMLKVDAKDLAVAPWVAIKDKTLTVGEWVASAGQAGGENEPIAVGVISVGRRRIPPRFGYLGVELRPRGNGDSGGAPVEFVFPGSAADKAGLKIDDAITTVNGKAVKDESALIIAMRAFRPGDVVALSVKRREKTLNLSVTLGANVDPERAHVGTMELLEGPVSKRSSDFRTVFQHDTVLRPMDCGGPVVDLTGKVIGINIARAGRTETYALPTDVVLPLIEPLENGKLAPASENPGLAPTTVPAPAGGG
jgi:serine protease Do